jgi:hypothetical protein
MMHSFPRTLFAMANVWVLYHAGYTMVLGIFSSEEAAFAALKAGKGESEYEDFDPHGPDVGVLKVPLDQLVSVGSQDSKAAVFVRRGE